MTSTVCCLLAQSAFDGITELLRLLVNLFDVAYTSNQFQLMCAPSYGWYKTMVTMFSILQKVQTQLNHRHDPSVGHGVANMKMIYVAPMKDLAQEVVTKFGQRTTSSKGCECVKWQVICSWRRKRLKRLMWLWQCRKSGTSWRGSRVPRNRCFVKWSYWWLIKCIYLWMNVALLLKRL